MHVARTPLFLPCHHRMTRCHVAPCRWWCCVGSLRSHFSIGGRGLGVDGDGGLGGIWARPMVGRRRRRRRWEPLRAGGKESPYDVLGVSPAATPAEIKRAYRKLALKFHPDVNKQAKAEEKFMRIKHAYNTLMNTNSRNKSEFRKGASDYYSTTSGGRKSDNVKEEEDFYGFGSFMRDVQITIEDFLRDLQTEFQNWEANAYSQGKPKSLWEELADIGEEFVEFLEKELNIADLNTDGENQETPSETPRPPNSRGDNQESTIKDNFDEIEAALAQLKKELGL